MVKAQDQWSQFGKEYLYNNESEDGTIVQVPFKVTNDFFIDRYQYYWHYDVNTPYPSVTTIDKKHDFYVAIEKAKIFRLNDFPAYQKELEIVLPDNLVLKGTGVRSLNELKPFEIVDRNVTYPYEKTNEMLEAVAQRFDSLGMISDEEIPKVFKRIRYMSNDPVLDLTNDKEFDEDSVSNDLRFSTIAVKVLKDLDKIGEHNGFIIKQ